MLLILTILLGILFIGLVIRALFYTALGICQIILGLFLIAIGSVIDSVTWTIKKIQLHWYLATRRWR